MTDLERTLIDLAQHGQARCGIGFGKYPLGVLDAIEALLPLADTPAVREALAAFRKRLGS